MSAYPGAIPSLPRPAGTDGLNLPDHADLHNDAADELEAIAAELGTNPSGAYSTVAARLAAMGGGGGGGGGVSFYQNSIPVMTSANTPSGVASDSEHYSTTDAWKAMTPAGGNGWLSNGSALPQWIGYEYPTARTAIAYSFRPWWADNYPSRTPAAWTFQGSNDGSTWDDLDTRSGFTPTDPAGRYVFVVGAPDSYTHYRMLITANNGNTYTGLGSFGIFTSDDPIPTPFVLDLSTPTVVA